MYAYKYTARNKNVEVPDDDGYRNNWKDQIDVAVVADNEADAFAKATALVLRDDFKLSAVAEMVDGTAVSIDY